LRLGITDGVIRLSVGIEPFERIWQDISQGLEAAMAY
jgi:cystathionine beta-lyase/cystathionine gamma-synthase